MKLSFTRKSFYVILFVDIFILTFAFFFSHLLRFDFNFAGQPRLMFLKALPVVLITKLICFIFFDLYRGMWRYTSLHDLLNIIKASTLSFLLIVFIILSQTRSIGFSRSVFIIDWCISISLIAGFRLSVRYYFEYFGDNRIKTNFKEFLSNFFPKNTGYKKRLIIIGAGNCGEKIFRELRDNARLKYCVVGFLDDHPTKIGKKIHGVPVIGPVSKIREAADQTKADEALIAIPSASSAQMRSIVSFCRESEIEFKTIPGMVELVDGKVTINSIREVAYQDLLGRDVIKLDEEKIGKYLMDQRVLVTGAGGSIGSELCRQICKYKTEMILLYERAESPLYEIEMELKKKFKHINVVPLLADICDVSELEKVFQKYMPTTVFHAAAYKHVPMLELQPWKAVANNVFGTTNLINAALKYNPERFVFVSTDKAVRPANIMGATKRLAEMLVHGQNGHELSKTKFMTVRFGNVVGSVGSVVPLFKNQIAKGGPVTVTHPEVTRYFMTIPEACQLILQAGALENINNSEIYLLDMGQPIKIIDMARDMIKLSGLEPDEDIKIEYIGLRPGEKLYEELITEGEGIVPTCHEKIMALKIDIQMPENFNADVNDLVLLAKERDAEKIKEKLQKIIPEYHPCQN
jgi:FlaA1/EpsC-like NDP-sugar epimerase